jgi:hypothetical protein
MPTLDLSGLEPVSLDPITYGDHTWEFTSDDLPAGPCIVLSTLFKRWFGAYDAFYSDPEHATAEDLAGVTAFEAKLPMLLAAIMQPRYPEMTERRVRELLPPVARAKMAAHFFTTFQSVKDGYTEAGTILATWNAAPPPLTAPPAIPTDPGASPRSRGSRAPATTTSPSAGSGG